MRNRHKFTFILCYIIADFLAIIGGSLLFLRIAENRPLNWDVFAFNSIIVSIICWLISTVHFDLYELNRFFNLTVFYRNTWRVLLMQLFLWYSFIFIYKAMAAHKFVNGALLFQLSFLLFYFLVSRFLFAVVLEKIKKWIDKPFNVAIWGFNKTSIELASQIETNALFINFLGIINDNTDLDYKNKASFNLALNRAIEAASEKNIHEMYVVAKPNYITDLNTYFELADNYCMRLKFVPDFSMISKGQFSSSNFNDFHVIIPRNEPLQNSYNRLIKRVFDLGFSILVILFVLSWLYPILGMIIKYQSKGPVLFKQLRTGKKNKSFECYKFRSMKMNVASDSLQAKKGDARVTRIGQFIRRTSIDELPQFFNVLLGDMSVVGPRPHMLKHTSDYNEQINNFMVRHFVKPGITGLAQVSGFRGETKKVLDMKRRVNADIDYLQNWNLIKDIKICFLTIIITLKGDDNAF